MKRIIAILIAVILLIAFTLPCCAEAVFETAWDLAQLWAPSNYPDYVCGVWSTDGSARNLTIAVLDTDEGNRGKQEILDLIEDDSTVTFTYGEYSRNYLTDVQGELSALFKTNEEHGLNGTALLEDTGKINLLILKDYEGNKKTEAMLKDLTSQYGDIFIVSYCDGFVEENLAVTPPVTTPITDSTTDRKIHPSVTTIALLLILIFSVAFMVVRKRKTAVMQNITGETATCSPPTETDIENAIKNANVEFPKALDETIMDKIETQINRSAE